jgi:drug/metabolite transporter (DMT)-like permease
MAYLVVFGSIVGYSAYTYALRHAPATIVGTYAYVNPVIAVLLGWLLLHEIISGRMLAAMAMILSAVLWIHLSDKALTAIGYRPSAGPKPAAAGAEPMAQPLQNRETA